MDSSARASTAIPALEEMEVGTVGFLGTLERLTDEDVRARSLLPGWSRGHVITHVCRNADALGQLVRGAMSGEQRHMYDSPEQRDRDIESGAGRSAEELRRDAAASAGRFLQAMNELDVRHEDVLVAKMPGTPPFPARDVATHRLVEVLVHHADLGLDFTHGDWTPGFSELVLGRVLEDRADGPAMVLHATDTGGLWRYGVAGQGPRVEGRACDLAWWVLGRGDGAGLTSDSDVLPELPKWR